MNNGNAAVILPPSRKTLAPALCLILVVLVAYWPTLSSDFITLDDPQYVTDNARVRFPSADGLLKFFTEVRHPQTVAGYYQPLTMASLMLDALLSGGPDVSPFICHLNNVLLHALTCVLLFLLLRRMVGGTIAPLLPALLFALHPVNVESVAWISQRKTVLATPLALGATLCYLDYATTGRRARLVASLGLYLLANLAKPTIVLLPFVLPLLDYWPLGRPVRRNLAAKWPFAIIMVVMGYVAQVSQASSIATMGVPNLSSADVLRRWVALVAYNCTLYLGNLVWPLHLAPFRAEPGSLALSSPDIAGSLAVMAGVTAIWLWSLRRCRPLFVGLTGFGILLSLALGPVRFYDSCVADRFLYVPFAFLLLPMAAGLAALSHRPRHRAPLVPIAVCLLLIPLAILMRAQQQVWRNRIAFWSHVSQAVPDYGIANIMLGLARFEAGELDEALTQARRAVDLRPSDGDAVGLLGRVLVAKGQAAEAVKLLDEGLKRPLQPDAGGTLLSLAEAHAVLGNWEDAVKRCEESIRVCGHSGEAWERLGDAAMRQARRFDRAAWAYRKAIESSPENLTARWNLGTCLEAMNDPAGAVEAYERVLNEQRRLGRPSPQLENAIQRLRNKLQSAGTTQPTARPS